MIYEPANLELCGEPYGLNAIRRLAPHLFNVYLQNQVLTADGPDALETWCRGEVRFRQIPLWGEGAFSFPPLMDALRSVGYEGYVTVHQASAELGTEARSARALAISSGCWRPIDDRYAYLDI